MTLGVGDPPDQITIASIDQIDDAIFKALQTVKGIALVERFATSKNTMTQPEILAMTGGKSPALFLCQGRGAVEDVIETLARGPAESIDRIEWMVLLIVVDTKQPKAALTSKAPGLAGLYPLQQSVLDAVNALEVPGLWNDSRIETKGHEWGLVEPGKLYVNVMRFSAAMLLNTASPIDLSRKLEEIDGNVNIADSIDPPHADLVDDFVVVTTDP
jgi:hypothetical protein